MITGLKRASAAALRARAAWRRIGCSMNRVAAQSFCSAGSASIASQRSTIASTFSNCSLPSSVTCSPSPTLSSTPAIFTRRARSAWRSPPTFSLKQR